MVCARDVLAQQWSALNQWTFHSVDPPDPGPRAREMADRLLQALEDAGYVVTPAVVAGSTREALNEVFRAEWGHRVELGRESNPDEILDVLTAAGWQPVRDGEAFKEGRRMRLSSAENPDFVSWPLYGLWEIQDD